MQQQRWLVLQRNSVRIPAATPTTFSWVVRRFSRSIYVNNWIVPRLGLERFLPDPLQFSIRQSSYHSALYSVTHWKCHLNRPHTYVRCGRSWQSERLVACQELWSTYLVLWRKNWILKGSKLCEYKLLFDRVTWLDLLVTGTFLVAAGLELQRPLVARWTDHALGVAGGGRPAGQPVGLPLSPAVDVGQSGAPYVQHIAGTSVRAQVGVIIVNGQVWDRQSTLLVAKHFTMLPVHSRRGR